MTLKLGIQHWVLEYYQVCSNDDPGFTMTYFTARSNLVPYAFVWEKGQTMDFSETIAVYDFKLATQDRSDKKFLLTSKLCPLNFKEIFLNLQKWTDVPVDIKLSSTRGCQHLPRGYIYV